MDKLTKMSTFGEMLESVSEKGEGLAELRVVKNWLQKRLEHLIISSERKKE